jgi:cytochrome c biogenesis protein CcdA
MELNSLLLLASTIALGFRHGVDWDHIAAIMDIVGTTTSSGSASDGSFKDLQKRALSLSTFYALGHSTVVLLLGTAALCFAAILPAWIDPLMERAVGITLLVLGAWVFYSLIRYLSGSGEFELKSRWMLIFAGIRYGTSWLRSKVTGQFKKAEFQVGQYGARTVFGTGMIHVMGAETGTQVFIVAAPGPAASHTSGIAMMLSFVLGLFTSNTIIAIIASMGFLTSARIKPLYIASGAVAGVFSVIVGTIFLNGHSDQLPDLQALLTSSMSAHGIFW